VGDLYAPPCTSALRHNTLIYKQKNATGVNAKDYADSSGVIFLLG